MQNIIHHPEAMHGNSRFPTNGLLILRYKTDPNCPTGHVSGHLVLVGSDLWSGAREGCLGLPQDREKSEPHAALGISSKPARICSIRAWRTKAFSSLLPTTVSRTRAGLGQGKHVGLRIEEKLTQLCMFRLHL